MAVIQSTLGTAWAVRASADRDDRDRAERRQHGEDPARARAAQARGDAPRRHDEQPEAGQRRGQAGREGDDEDHAQADLVLGHRAEEHDERRGARDEPGRGAHRQQRARAQVAVVVVRAVTVVVVPVARGRGRGACSCSCCVVVPVSSWSCPCHARRARAAHARAHDRRPDAEHEQPGDEVQPRVEVLGEHVGRQRERHRPEGEDADRVRDRHGQPERDGVARGAARADEVGGDHRLAVAGRQRVHRAPSEGREQEQQRARPGRRPRARRPSRSGRPRRGRSSSCPRRRRRAAP